MQTQNFRQRFWHILQTVVASDVPALYGSLLLRSSSLAAFLSLAVSIPVSVVQAETIGDWKINPSTGTVEVLLPEGSSPRVSASNLPPRLILDLPNIRVGVNVTERYETGVVRQVSLTQANPNRATLVVEFAPGVVVDTEDVDLRQIGVDNLWVLRPTLETLPPEEQLSPIAQTPQTTGDPVLDAIAQATSRQDTPQTTGDPVLDAIAQATSRQDTAQTTPDPVADAIAQATSRQDTAQTTPDPIADAIAQATSRQDTPQTTGDPVLDAIAQATSRQNRPQPLTRSYDPGPTASPNFEPSRETSLDLVRVPLQQPNQVQVLPSVAPPLPPSENVLLVPPTTIQSAAVPFPQPVPYGQPAYNPVLVPQNPPYIGTDPLARSIPFGEPLRSLPPSQGYLDQRPPAILLPTGTRLTLLFPTDNRVRLAPRPDRQEVLLLQGGVVDSLGNYIIPPDTPIVGAFETSSKGSRFIATAINLEGRSIPITGQSNWIPGSLDVSAEKVALGTGIGGLGVFLVSGFSGIGLLAGAIGGAAVGVATSPEPTTLQPGQQIEIQLTQDLTTTTFLVGNQ